MLRVELYKCISFIVLRRECLINISTYIYISPNIITFVTCYSLVKWYLTDKCFSIYNKSD